MRRYTAEDEERIRMQAQVRAWVRSGLLNAGQARTIDGRLRTTLRRTNVFLRLVLALFTVLIAAASVAFSLEAFAIHTDRAIGVTLAVGAMIAIVLAEYLIGAFRLHAYGVEEALAAAAVVMLATSAVELTTAGGHTMRPSLTLWLAGAATGAGLTYARYRWVYAAVAAAVCASLVPFVLFEDPSLGRVLAAAVFGAVFIGARALQPGRGDRHHGADSAGGDCAAIAAASYAGMYLMLNLHLAFREVLPATTVAAPQWFYWSTWAATWMMPPIGLALAIRDKDRPLLVVALAMSLATLYTNKPYLGWPRQTWDPILLGVLLVAVATVLRRWLASGPNGQRHGFTAERILESDRATLTALATASAMWPRQEQQAPGVVDTPPSQFEGGRSGGGGGGAAY
jgi:hypothetical protein